MAVVRPVGARLFPQPYLTRSTEESLTKLAGETRSAPAAGPGPDRVTLLTVRLDAQCKWKSSLSKKLNQSTMDQLGHQLGATEPADVILLAIGPRNSVVSNLFLSAEHCNVTTRRSIGQTKSTVWQNGTH